MIKNEKQLIKELTCDELCALRETCNKGFSLSNINKKDLRKMIDKKIDESDCAFCKSFVLKKKHHGFKRRP